MSKFSATSIAAITAVFLASGAYAADINGSTKDGPGIFSDAPKSVNWSGLYIGGQIGYGKATTDLSVIEHYPDLTAGAPAGSVASTEFLGFNGLGSDGFTGGGRVGFDIARSRFLFGVFGEYNLSNVESELSFNFGPGASATYTAEKENEWSLGARAGVLVNPRTLVYVLAAYTQADVSLNGPGIGTVTGLNTDETLTGISVGTGVEYALSNNVFLGLEGIYTTYDEVRWFDGRGSDPYGTTVEGETDELKVMGTLKFKLGSGLPGLSD